MTAPLLTPTHRAWLQSELRGLLDFGRGFAAEGGGAAYLDLGGRPDPTRPVETWITGRMAHVYGLGALLGVPGCGPLADRALAGLWGAGAPLRDAEHGGWFAATDDPVKPAYAHAFVVLAAATGTLAERRGASELLDDALRVFDAHFWDEGEGLVVDQWDMGWAVPAVYRGLNAAMHTVEALLAAYDATGERRHAARAGRICTRVQAWAKVNQWRIPEHFDEQWRPVLDYNRDRPEDRFKPYGATVGHGFEWARLFVQTARTLGEGAPEGLIDDAIALYARARLDGWSVDGAPGFVYTTDWHGVPVVHDRMHWVAAEAIGAAAVLHHAIGGAAYRHDYVAWWSHVAETVIDREHGSWHHQLDASNRPIGSVWPGKPDLYHAVQACLIPRLPVVPGTARAILTGGLDGGPDGGLEG